MGANALTANTTASNNTAVGSASLISNTTGANNTGLGNSALYTNTTASSNTAVGYQSLYLNTTGATNVGVGTNALRSNTTATANAALGYSALYTNTTGANNTALGFEALALSTTGSNNTSVGKDALRANTTGGNNTCIGYQAGNDITAGNKNIIIGSLADAGNVGRANSITMGYAVTGGSNDAFLFGFSTTDSQIVFGATSITAPSDIRLKEDIQDEEAGLDFINDLRPVTFLWKKEKDIPSEMKAHKEGSEERTMNGKYNHGFIAQEVKATIDSHGLKEGFDMWQEDDSDGRQRVAPSALVPMLTKAIQELSAQVDALTARITTLEG